jgi:CPA2 family monovalent cation:H+ antiporter-2
MPELAFFLDLVLAIGAALVGGVVARRLGQPPLLGYLLAGIVIGPHTPGPVSEIHHVSTLAEIGVVLLMFEIGVEFPIARLRRVRAVAFGGGLLSVLLIGAAGAGIGRILGFSLVQQVFFGAAMSLASTMVALKMLSSLGDMDTPHGEITVGITLVEDLCLIAMLVLLPAWAAAGAEVASPLLFAVSKALALFIGTYFVGGLLLPALFAAVARLRSRELFLLTEILVVIGTTVGLAALGLSPALGAYLAGVVVSRSHYSRQVLAELVPSRDLFASLFFVSVGMLVNPFLLWQHPEMLLVVVGVILLIRPLIIASIVRAFGYGTGTAVMTGLLLAHIGELSFVLAKLGADRRFISEELYGMVLGGALISILINPVLLRHGAPRLLRRLKRPALEPALPGGPDGDDRLLHDHLIICGCGRIGSEIATQLRSKRIPYIIIELNPIRVEELRRTGEPCLFGDATNRYILKAAGIERAKLLAVTHYDAAAAELTIQEALQFRPSIEIIARAHTPTELERLRKAGASEVVVPEFEAGMEFLRWSLEHLGLSAGEAETLIRLRRAEFKPDEPIDNKSDERPGQA